MARLFGGGLPLKAEKNRDHRSEMYFPNATPVEYKKRRVRHYTFGKYRCTHLSQMHVF
jgi:hypothetical protein